MLLGATDSTNGDITQSLGQEDIWLAKIDPQQLSTPTLVKNSVRVYPNPTAEILNIEIEDNISLDKIAVTDVSGKTVIVQTETTTQINTENLANGMYLIQAFSGENKYQAKFIKQ
jgi:hypothetical protein